MNKNKSFSIYVLRTLTLIVGLFTIALGVALSSKTGLGVSPSASLAYVLSKEFPISMGNFTTLINVGFVVLQILLLRSRYKAVNLLQLGVVFLFGYFTDFTMGLVSGLEVTSYPLRLALTVLSCMVMAFGVFLEVKASLMVMAAEGAINALSDIVKLDFGTLKILFDWGFIILSSVLSFLFFHQLVGVREGTVIAAFLVGFFVRFYNRYILFLNPLLQLDKVEMEHPILGGKEYPLVITIERELGSCGHEIGQKLAKSLGIKFYDYNLIEETAKAMGLPAEEVGKNEERHPIGILSAVYQNAYAMSQTNSRQDEIFLAQSKVIREIASKESCVIVGRLGAYVLKGRLHTMNLFFSADFDFRAKNISKRHNLPLEEARSLVKKEDALRAAYSRHITGEPWGKCYHYSMALHTSDYSTDDALNLILQALEAGKKNAGVE